MTTMTATLLQRTITLKDKDGQATSFKPGLLLSEVPDWARDRIPAHAWHTIEIPDIYVRALGGSGEGEGNGSVGSEFDFSRSQLTAILTWLGADYPKGGSKGVLLATLRHTLLSNAGVTDATDA